MTDSFPNQDDLVDALLDLQHDLGKYLNLPLAMLPTDATDDDVRQAAHEALFRTRRGPDGRGGPSQVTGAAEIWAAFLAEVGEALDERPVYGALRLAVDRAFAHGDALAAADPAALRADLGAVSPAIRAVLREVRDG